MATKELDDVDEVKVGSYVEWMRADDDISRGDLGQVIGVDEKTKKCRVQFEEGIWELYAERLNVCDFQQNTFVHVIDDEVDPEAVGVIKCWEFGKLQVEILGKNKFYLPKKLIRCDIQAGMFCFWIKSDEDVAKDHLGVVTMVLNEKGLCKVLFPKGEWKFKPWDLARAHIQPGMYVHWKKHDEDIAEGEVGQVWWEKPNEDGKVKVSFAKDQWWFKPEDLVPAEIQKGSLVTWKKSTEDIPEGHIGTVLSIKEDRQLLKLRFPNGLFKTDYHLLNRYHFQAGDYVYWKGADDSIPEGDIGEIVRIHGHEKNLLRVQFTKGAWSLKPDQLTELKFQKGDLVQWKKVDDDIPKGEVGTVTGVRQKEDLGDRLYVRFPKGQWSFSPDSLRGSDEQVDLNEIKATFKLFDRNGDGKLSPEELFGVLRQLHGEKALTQEECDELFSGLDKDGDGKLTTDEFLDYVFA